MRKIALRSLVHFIAGTLAIAADTYQTGKIVKWDNGNYPDGKKTKAWIVYQVQGDNLLYSIARHKETKPQMEPGEQIQYHVKGNQMDGGQRQREEKQLPDRRTVASAAPPQ